MKLTNAIAINISFFDFDYKNNPPDSIFISKHNSWELNEDVEFTVDVPSTISEMTFAFRQILFQDEGYRVYNQNIVYDNNHIYTTFPTLIPPDEKVI